MTIDFKDGVGTGVHGGIGQLKDQVNPLLFWFYSGQADYRMIMQ